MRVLLALTSGFAGGILMRSLFITGWPWILFFVLLAAICFGARLFVARQIFFLSGLFLCALILGVFRFASADTPLPSLFLSHVRHRVSYEGVVSGFPDVRDDSVRTPVRVTDSGVTTTVLVVSGPLVVPQVEDHVYVSGTLAVPEAFAGDNGRTFQYDRYLERDGIRFLLNYAYVDVEQSAPWYAPHALLGRVHDTYVRGLNAALPEPYASLARGITLGGKSGLGSELKEDFTKTGIIQIIVLSGYHVMLVATAVLALLGHTRLTRKKRAVVGAVVILLFVFIAGAGSAALRALVMALIALFATATGRSYAAGRALLLAILVLLVWNPYLLAFDPGFSLSVAATAGLIWGAPLLEARLSFVPSAFLREALSITLAAQLAVLPLLMYFMGTVSFVSIPANVLIMPVVPFAMLASLLAGVLGSLLGITGMVIAAGFPAYLATGYLIQVAKESAALPWATLSVPPFSFGYVVLAYLLLGYAVASARRFSTTPQLRLLKKASM